MLSSGTIIEKYRHEGRAIARLNRLTMKKIVLLMGVALTGLFVVCGLAKDKSVNTMTDKELKCAIDSLAKIEQPLSAAPLIAEAKKRARAAQDTRWMLSLVKTDIRLNGRRLLRETTPSAEFTKAAADAWTPLRQLLSLEAFLQNGDALSPAKAALDEPETLRSYKAELAGADGWAARLNLLDYIATSIVLRGKAWRNSAAEAASLAVSEMEASAVANDDRMSKILSRVLRFTMPRGAVAESADSLMKDLEAIGARTDEELALVNFAKAAWLTERAKAIGKHDISGGDAKVAEALALFQGAAKTLAGSPFATLAEEQAQCIEKQEVFVGSDGQVVPGGFLPIYMKYRNTDEVTIKVYRAPAIEGKPMAEVLKTEKSVEEKKLRLPQTDIRLNVSSAYAELGGLRPGLYVVAAFIGDSLKAAEMVTCSQISVSNFSADYGGRMLLVKDYLTGEALTSATVNKKSKPDADGWCRLNVTGDNREVVIRRAEDTFRFQSYADGRRDRFNPDKRVKRAKVLTDRAIYRPGQTVMYKAFVYNSGYDRVEPAAKGARYKLTLYAQNGKELARQDLRLDGLGSAWGEMAIPSDAPKGGGYICVEEKGARLCWQSVRIEDFKRMDNTVSIDPFTEALLPGATATVGGVAMSAAGLPVAGASTKYTISSEDGEVLCDGLTTTDSDGRFGFSFKTKDEDETYSIEVRVTDLKGETATAQAFCHLWAQGSSVNVEQEEDVDVVGGGHKLVLRSVNSNGWPFASTVHLKLTPYEANGGLRPKATTVVDTVICAAPHLDNLPASALGTMAKRPAFEADYDVKGKRELWLDSLGLAPGKYDIELTGRALDGSQLKSKSCVTLLAQEGPMAGLDYVGIFAPDKVTNGERLNFKIFSGLADAHVSVVVARRGKMDWRRTVDVSCGVANVAYDVPADAVDGEVLRIVANVCKDGRSYFAEDREVRVRRQEKALTLSLKTFRDHSRPGARETWTISTDMGPAGSIVSSMYDSRLDKYVSSEWDPSFYRLTVGNGVYRWSVSPSLPRRPIEGIPFGLQYWWSGCDYSLSGVLRNAMDGLTAKGDEWQYFTTPMPAMAYGVSGVRGLRMNKSAMVMESGAEEDALASDMELCEVVTVAQNNALGAIDADAVQGGDSAPLRSNFAETVFFKPDLRADSAGLVTFSFDLPDNLTTYKFRALATDSRLRSALVTQTLTVSKPLNVRLGVPRFLTEGDTVSIAADVTVADTAVTRAAVSLTVSDAETGRTLMTLPTHEVEFGGVLSQKAVWQLTVPLGVDGIRLEVIAKANGASDGERVELPVAQLYRQVTESHTFVLNKKGEHTIENPFNGKEARALTFSYTSNAFIEVLRSLPQLGSGWQPCTDTYLGRYETAAIAQMLKQKPEVAKAVDYLRAHAAADTAAYRIADAEHTPWLYVAKALRQHDKDVVKLMSGSHADKMKAEAIAKLANMQLPSGEFPWFSGMDGSRWMTVNVVSTIGELMRLGVVRADERYVAQICQKAIPYLDKQLTASLKEYNKCLAEAGKTGGRRDAFLDNMTLELLHARLLMGPKVGADAQSLIDILQEHWQYPSACDRVTASTILAQAGRTAEARLIAKSLEENLVQTKDGTAFVAETGFLRRRALVEAQAMLIMTLQRLNHASPNLPKLINHLVLMKRGSDWPDAQSSSRAVLALLASQAKVEARDVVRIGGQEIVCSVEQPKVDVSLDPSADVAKAQVIKSGGIASWGSWQRVAFVPQDGGMKADGSDKLRVERLLEVRRQVKGRMEWVAVGPDSLAIGDQVRATLRFYNDEPLSFVRLRDHRAAALEPEDKLSGYRGWWWWRWVDADVPTPPHYMSIADETVEFFIDYLNDGWHSVSYVMTVTNGGDFAGGYADATCMYDTEIAAHSDGVRIKTR